MPKDLLPPTIVRHLGPSGRFTVGIDGVTSNKGGEIEGKLREGGRCGGARDDEGRCVGWSFQCLAVKETPAPRGVIMEAKGKCSYSNEHQKPNPK